MSKFMEKARQIVRGAEVDVQALIDSASRARRYEDVPALARLAEQLACILGEAEGSPSSTTPEQEEGDTAFLQTESVGCELAGSSGQVSGRASPPRHEKPGKDRQGQLEYPRFVRDGDSLVKIGLSRGSQATYEHRVPKAVLDTIVERALSAYEGGRRPLTAEALSNVHRHGDKEKIPGYQLYLCLGWLKRQGLVTRCGRKGYTLPRPESFVADVAEAWEYLDGLGGGSSSDDKAN